MKKIVNSYKDIMTMEPGKRNCFLIITFQHAGSSPIKYGILFMKSKNISFIFGVKNNGNK